MAFLGKYGVARHIYVPVIKRGVVDFAVGADWTPAAGDVKISKDGGAAANVTNLPVAIAMGNAAQWDFSLTATEMQAAQVMVTVADSAAKAVEDQMFVIETYGNASAQHALDLGTAISAQAVASVTGAVGSVTGLTASNLDATVSSRATPTNITAGTITTVTNLTNAPTAGDFTAAMKTSIGTAVAASAVASVTGNVGGNVTGSVGSVVGAVGSVTGLTASNLDVAVSSRLASASYTAPDNTTIAAIAGYIDTEVAAIKAKTDQLVFTTANMLDCAIKRVGDTTLTAAGTGGQGYGG